MRYLIFNAGSSSIKFKLFERRQGKFKQLDSGGVDRIGDQVKNHQEALEKIIRDRSLDIGSIDLIGHRIVHGGGEFFIPTELNIKNLKKIEKYNKLAPLHNPVEISLVRAINSIDSSVLQYGVFDTSFFVGLPDRTKIYPLPYSYFQKDKIRRYGFHGISHKYLSVYGTKKLGLNLTDSNLITIHLGAGSSVSAIRNGSPIDTSLGFTPLEGLMMQTRSGDIDPGIITYLQNENNFKAEQIDDLLNNQSGLLGISGRGDMRDILFLAGERVEDDNYKPEGFDNCSQSDINRAKLALEMYCYRVSKYIGGYGAILGDLDGIIFGGAIGSGSSVIRKRITSNISRAIEGVKITQIETNEELQIANEIEKELNN
jgi:acetate kinase